RPDSIVAGIDDGGDVDAGHGATSALLPRRTLGRGLALCRGRGRRGRLVAATSTSPALARGVPDALHVAGLADQARHLGEATAFAADVRQDGVDQRRLNAVAQRRVDSLVGGAAAAIATAMAVAVEAVDLENADALDLLHRLDALAHDALNAVEQLS